MQLFVLRSAIKVNNQAVSFSVLFYLLFSFNVYAQITPVMNIIREPDFGELVFVPGSCLLDYQTGQVTDLVASNTCINASGTVGKYQLVVNSNTLVSIKILQRDNEGDNLMFVPEGQLVSSVQTIDITPNIAQQINSGATGVITINLGGRLYINQYLNPSSTYHLTKEDGIEWSELP